MIDRIPDLLKAAICASILLLTAALEILLVIILISDWAGFKQ